MKIYETKSALKVFYYIMAIDGAIGEDELQRFYEVGEALDRKCFDSYKDAIEEECQKHITTIDSDDDYYDIIQEGVDAALCHEATGEDKGLTPRLLVWNLYAVAFSNNECNAAEKKLIAHVARVSGVEKAILLEMEQMMQTAVSVKREMLWLQQSDRPYSEVRPLVDNLEARIRVISDAATALIEDEVVLDDPFEAKPDILDKAKSAINDTVTPMLHTAGDKAKVVGSKVSDAVSEKWQGLFGKKKKDESDPEKEEQ